MPLALLAIGSELDPEIYEIVTIDGRLDADADSAVLSNIEGAVCLGVTVLTGAPISDALRISRAAKRARPDLPVVWGGWHPSMFARECLVEPSVDVTVRGQGEETFAEIVSRLAEGRSSGRLRRLHRAARRWNHPRESGTAAGAGGQVSGARLRADSGRALLRAERQTPTRLHLLAGLQLPLRVLFRPVRLWTQVGGAGTGAHGHAPEGVVGSIPLR